MWKILAKPHYFIKMGSLTPPSVCIKSGKWMVIHCMCVLGVSTLAFSTILIFDIGNVATIWYLFMSCYDIHKW